MKMMKSRVFIHNFDMNMTKSRVFIHNIDSFTRNKLYLALVRKT
jgi:hypothetical protein